MADTANQIVRRLPEYADDISFELPRGFKQDRERDKARTEKTIAQIFACYLLGTQAYRNSDFRLGPYWTSDRYWQLDHSNDYFLEFVENDRVRLYSRYPRQGKVIEAMAALFLAHYGDRE